MATAFTVERWDKTLLLNFRAAEGAFGAKIVNRNFSNPAGEKADAVKIFRPDLSVIGTSTAAGMAMPTFNDVASVTYTLNLDKPIKYAVGLPWEVELKTEYDLMRGYQLAAEDVCQDIRNDFILTAVDAANIDTVVGTAAAPVVVTKDTIGALLTKLRVHLMKSGAIMKNGVYRFLNDEVQENASELEGVSTTLEGEAQPPGVLAGQVRTALPVLGVSGDVYELIMEATTHSGTLTENKEYFGHIPVFRGFEIVLDENLNKESYHVIYAATRNLVTEAATASKSKVIDDGDNYRDILRGMIIYGCMVTNEKAGCKAFVTLQAPTP